MIDLCSYRARIGSFSCLKSFGSLTFDGEDSANYCYKKSMGYLVVLCTLLVIGCVEMNPGPLDPDLLEGLPKKHHKHIKSTREDKDGQVWVTTKRNKEHKIEYYAKMMKRMEDMHKGGKESTDGGGKAKNSGTMLKADMEKELNKYKNMYGELPKRGRPKKEGTDFELPTQIHPGQIPVNYRNLYTFKRPTYDAPNKLVSQRLAPSAVPTHNRVNSASGRDLRTEATHSYRPLRHDDLPFDYVGPDGQRKINYGLAPPHVRQEIERRLGRGGGVSNIPADLPPKKKPENEGGNTDTDTDEFDTADEDDYNKYGDEMVEEGPWTVRDPIETLEPSNIRTDLSSYGLKAMPWVTLSILEVDNNGVTGEHIPQEGVNDDGSPIEVVYQPTRLTTGELIFPMNNSSVNMPDMIGVPYIRKIRVFCDEPQKVNVLFTDMEKATLAGYPTAETQFTFKSGETLFLLCEPPDLQEWSPMLNENEEEIKFNVIEKENPFDNVAYEQRVSLEPLPVEKTMLRLETKQTQHHWYEVAWKADRKIYRPLVCPENVTEGPRSGDEYEIDQTDPNEVGFFCPDGSMHILVHTFHTNTFKPTKEVPFPVDVKDLLAYPYQERGSKYRIEIEWTETFWPKKSYMNNKVFMGKKYHKMDKTRLLYPNEKENLKVVSAHLPWNSSDLNPVELHSSHRGFVKGHTFKRKHGSHYLRMLRSVNPEGTYHIGTKKLEFADVHKFFTKHDDPRILSDSRSRGLVEPKIEQAKKHCKRYPFTLDHITEKVHPKVHMRLGIAPALILAGIAAASKTANATLNTVAEVAQATHIPNVGDHIDYEYKKRSLLYSKSNMFTRLVGLGEDGDENEIKQINIPQCLSFPDITAQTETTSTVERYLMESSHNPIPVLSHGVIAATNIPKVFSLNREGALFNRGVVANFPVGFWDPSLFVAGLYATNTTDDAYPQFIAPGDGTIGTLKGIANGANNKDTIVNEIGRHVFDKSYLPDLHKAFQSPSTLKGNFVFYMTNDQHNQMEYVDNLPSLGIGPIKLSVQLIDERWDNIIYQTFKLSEESMSLTMKYTDKEFLPSPVEHTGIDVDENEELFPEDKPLIFALPIDSFKIPTSPGSRVWFKMEQTNPYWSGIYNGGFEKDTSMYFSITTAQGTESKIKSSGLIEDWPKANFGIYGNDKKLGFYPETYEQSKVALVLLFDLYIPYDKVSNTLKAYSYQWQCYPRDLEGEDEKYYFAIYSEENGQKSWTNSGEMYGKESYFRHVYTDLGSEFGEIPDFGNLILIKDMKFGQVEVDSGTRGDGNFTPPSNPIELKSKMDLDIPSQDEVRKKRNVSFLLPEDYSSCSEEGYSTDATSGEDETEDDDERVYVKSLKGDVKRRKYTGPKEQSDLRNLPIEHIKKTDITGYLI